MLQILCRIGISLIFIGNIWMIASAQTIREDIVESMYFSRTSVATQIIPERRAFQDGLNKNEVVLRQEIRQARLLEIFNDLIKREGFSFEDAVTHVEGVIRGLTGEQAVLEWLGTPDEVVDNELIPWSLTNGSVVYHINRDSYPEPRAQQKVIARKFFYVSDNGPRKEQSLEVLVTINKATGIVEDCKLYFDIKDGSIPVWKAGMVSNG